MKKKNISWVSNKLWLFINISGKFWNLIEIRSKSKKYWKKKFTIGTRYPKIERSEAMQKKSKTGRGLKLYTYMR